MAANTKAAIFIYFLPVKTAFLDKAGK